MIKFITSANDLNSYPDSEKEVVFVGRSNVGKSSLINALYGEVAYVGKTPGKTKLLNFFNWKSCPSKTFNFIKKEKIFYFLLINLK